MSVAVDVSVGMRDRDVSEDLDDGLELDSDSWDFVGPAGRRACPECGVVLGVDPDADGSAVPEHAVCTSAWDPFGVRRCPGSGAGFADPGELPAVAPLLLPLPLASPVTVLPAGLDWRAQPFSHTL
ncbi:hypothetical protein [Embleya sp. AB8]|uniref:hypothetical protein n=1 Tax=Embleya sp. AB8 TaxID=3156304 RepID=UPI003C72B3B5